MPIHSFTGKVLAGHKQDAVEVPFDPADKLGAKSTAMGPGRRGVAVKCKLNGVEFRSHVVARSNRFWLLIEPTVEAQAEIRAGETVTIAMEPDLAASV